MRISLILFICGIMNIFWGLLMLVPCGVDFFYKQNQSAENFLLCALGTAFLGAVISAISYRSWNDKPSLKEMFITTSSVWIDLAFFGALPFYFSEYSISFTDAIFESISGLTTTGATILAHIDSLPQGFLIWRAMTQWIGGIGIVILAITILPILRIGGMQLFSTESSDSSGKDSPFVVSKLKRFIRAYLFVSFLCTVCLILAGMSFFDAIAHMMTCVSTGGFSTHDLSVGYYQSPAIEWVLTFFMTVGGIPLATILALLEWRWEKVKKDFQTRTYLLTLFYLILPISTCMWLFMDRFDNFWDTLRTFAFHTVSIMTTTGYVSENYALWGPFFMLFFLLLTAVGGCTGSTSGGIKIFRFSILFKAVRRQLMLMTSPHAILIPRYNNKPVTNDIVLSVMSFMTIFSITTATCAIILSISGMDIVTSLSGSLTAIANVGPGLGKIIGPDKSFILLPNLAKWALSITMLLGRLEFMTVIVLFLPKLWSKN